MAEYITLMGTEQVQSAASTIRNAAEEMQRAAGNIAHALETHQRFMEGWLQTLEQIMTDAKS